ncbi:aa3-type cytochrome c oxidase subunit IV [Phenylobacterium sp.]|jgi:hypothetical protein|uniref:aa3-type cytochrome c oxidase subunit IV n=1 Tax=Phenylobacterium sp. TaxID=1871053 RepID=UPI0037851DAC
MADATNDYHRGEMDIAEQVSTYGLVMGITKWGSLATAVLVLWLTLFFCTETGFLGSSAAAFVLLVVGVLALKKKSAH